MLTSKCKCISNCFYFLNCVYVYKKFSNNPVRMYIISTIKNTPVSPITANNKVVFLLDCVFAG